MLAAILRKGRAGELRPQERERAARAFRREFATSYVLVPPEPTVVHKAMDLILTYPLRGYDAVQLASALALPALPADDGLLAVTKRLRLPTENPNLHL